MLNYPKIIFSIESLKEFSINFLSYMFYVNKPKAI